MSHQQLINKSSVTNFSADVETGSIKRLTLESSLTNKNTPRPELFHFHHAHIEAVLFLHVFGHTQDIHVRVTIDVISQTNRIHALTVSFRCFPWSNIHFMLNEFIRLTKLHNFCHMKY